MRYTYLNVQCRTVPTFGVWSRISAVDLEHLSALQEDAWEVYHTVNIRGSYGFTAHVLFMLRRPSEA